jgi:conjugal transfer pilus assembly protein TraV
VLQSVALTPAVDKPTPIRTPAKVMRAWFAPWADVHDVLHAGGYQFVEIEARRWSLGEPESSSEPVRSFAIPKGDLPEPVGKDPSAQTARAGSERSNRTPTLPNPGAPK